MGNLLTQLHPSSYPGGYEAGCWSHLLSGSRRRRPRYDLFNKRLPPPRTHWESFCNPIEPSDLPTTQEEPSGVNDDEGNRLKGAAQIPLEKGLSTEGGSSWRNNFHTFRGPPKSFSP